MEKWCMLHWKVFNLYSKTSFPFIDSLTNARRELISKSLICYVVIVIIISFICLSWLYYWQIRKSMVAAEAAHAKGSAGQASSSAKGSQGKTPSNIIGSPNLKVS